MSTGSAGTARLAILGMAGLALVAVTPANTTHAAGYYEGKTISLIVGFSAGGGVDAAARVMADHLSRHIEGNPTVIVKNMTGGASIKAQNFVFEKARPDGTTVFFGPWFPISQVVKAPGIRFRYEDFTVLGAMAAGQLITYARAGMLPGGSKAPKDITKAASLRLAGSHPTNPLDATNRLALDLLGVKYVYVRGYRGNTKIRAAVLNGEVDMGGDSIRGYLGGIKPSMVATGKAIPLWTVSAPGAGGKLARVPEVSEVPTIAEVYEAARGKAPAGPYWDALKFILETYGQASHQYLGPPKMQQAAVDALSKGIAATAKDDKYLADAFKRFKVKPAHVSRQTAQQTIELLRLIDPKIQKTLQDHVAAGLK